MPRVKVRQAKDGDKEDRIQQALEKSAQEGTSFRDLENKFGVGWSTLNDHARGGKSRQEAHQEYHHSP
jgi:transposase